MSTYCTSTLQLGSTVRGGFAMPTFGGTAVSGSAVFARRERHDAVELGMTAGIAAVVTDVPSDIWAGAANGVATQPKRIPGTQVWSPPT